MFGSWTFIAGSSPVYLTHGLGSLMVEHQFVALKGGGSTPLLDPKNSGNIGNYASGCSTEKMYR